MAETGGGSAPPPPRRPRAVPPMITLPPRSSDDTFFTGLSPGPITLVSNFFSDQYPDADLPSFSQLLAGALASPAAQNPPALVLYNNSSSKESDCENDSGGFKQNRPMDLVIAQSPSGFFSPLQCPFGISHQQALAQVTAEAVLSQSFINYIQPENRPSSLAGPKEESQTSQTSDLEDSQIESLDNVSVSQSGNTNLQPVVSVSKPASDGYSWRKYGQKQVKASERPRSYYKCTQTNCPVKKKIGHSLDGQISDITYKGQHNHERPQLRKLAKEGAAAINKHKSFVEEPTDTHEQVNHLMTNEETGDEPHPKRRNTGVASVDLACSSHVMVTEPKIVVQTRSEVDILDDGFKWRKYGQKVVKGNTNPRSYYRCTYAGCNVRKHVERASSDPKSVVTTYEGKHKHDIPVVAKSLSRKETSFNTKRPILLQLKEEQITA